MKYTLKDYQQDAYVDVRDRLDDARHKWNVADQATSFSLTAPTGAGKTVIATAVIESLFFGDEALDFEADETATVLWFSDSPALNGQSRRRLIEASDKLEPADLVMVRPPFSQRALEPGKVYFLNTQAMGKNSLLTRGHQDGGDGQFDEFRAAPDMQGYTIWQTIAITVNDPDTTLVLVLDEAHRGFRTQRTATDKPTIVRRLVSGSDDGTQPAVPIVWGISATIDRFRAAMREADAKNERASLRDAEVDPRRVQESGLVKDAIVLEIPDEAGDFDTALVRRATRKLRDSTNKWAEYARQQGNPQPVRPLMVFQVPNKPDEEEVRAALDVIFDEYPEIGAEHVRHVFGDHAVQSFGPHEVEYIEPELVQDTRKVRVLLAKDAVSTGWDCPRAEVMVSFRAARDKTHVTQLLGRLVRNPLARRVPGDERLNSVECILPRFDRTVAGEVVRTLTGKTSEEAEASGPAAILDGRDLLPNPGISPDVWECWDGLPSLTIPQRGARPHVRLQSLAVALSADGLRPNAFAEAKRFTTNLLAGDARRHEDALADAVRQVQTLQGQAISGSTQDDRLGYQRFTERADRRSLRADSKNAARAFGGDFAGAYFDTVWDADESGDGLDDLDAMAHVAGLATLPAVRDHYDSEVEKLADEWFDEHRVGIRELPDDRRAVYEETRALSTQPKLTPLQRPRTRIGEFCALDENDEKAPVELRPLHLMSDAEGEYPIAKLNQLEVDILDAELARDSIEGWYRNPPRQASDSLGVSYRDGSRGELHTMHPDFVFFHRVNGQVRPSIVDPHGHHLDDALTKIVALAQFAEQHGEAFHRIEALSVLEGRVRVLDLQDEVTRRAVADAVRDGRPAGWLYDSSVGATFA